MMKNIEVVAAIIIHDEKILCVQRGAHQREYIAFKYEFPGGKVEPNESREGALLREIKEELNIDISIQKAFVMVNHQYPDFMLHMYSFICTCESQDLQLTEHIKYQWLTKENLLGLDWAAADVPIVEALIEGN